MSEILGIARRIIQAQHLERRFIVFPTFIAGFASENEASKALALELLAATQRGEIGRTTSAVIQLLQKVYELENQTLMGVGADVQVDWIDVMESEHMHIVYFGL